MWEEDEMICARSPPKWGGDAFHFVYTHRKGGGESSPHEHQLVTTTRENGGSSWRGWCHYAFSSSPPSVSRQSPPLSTFQWMAGFLETRATQTAPPRSPLMVMVEQSDPPNTTSALAEDDFFFLGDSEGTSTDDREPPPPSPTID